MRYIFSLTFILFASVLYSQKNEWHWGIEPTTNIVFSGVQPGGLPLGVNGFVKYDSHEFYLGTASYGASIYGLETGLKYHFHSNKRLSHFFIDFNFQNTRYSTGASLPVSYSYTPKDTLDPIALYRVKTYILSSALGYEVNFTKWLSFTIAIGPGLDYYTEKNTWVVKYQCPGQTDEKGWKGVKFIKAAIRVTI
jgi:hypothetical protein